MEKKNTYPKFSKYLKYDYGSIRETEYYKLYQDDIEEIHQELRALLMEKKQFLGWLEIAVIAHMVQTNYNFENE